MRYLFYFRNNLLFLQFRLHQQLPIVNPFHSRSALIEQFLLLQRLSDLGVMNALALHDLHLPVRLQSADPLLCLVHIFFFKSSVLLS